MKRVHLKTPYDYAASSFTGMTNDHYKEIFSDLMYGIIKNASLGCARQRIPGPRSHHGLLADELEGFTRSFIMAGPWMATCGKPVISKNNEQYDVGEFYRQGILNGTDPHHPEYWGDITDYAQHLVEMASLAWSLYLSREHIWNHYTEKEKRQIADYLFQCTKVTYHHNNWLLFNVVTNAVLKKLGMPYSQQQIDDHIEACDHMYMGDGWYRDGNINRIDYYNAWAFHYYYLIWVMLEGEDYQEKAERHGERIGKFARALRYFISGDGSVPCFGRSMIYRFGYLAPLALGYRLGALDIDTGELRTMYNTTLRFFFENEILTDNGHLSMGFLRPAEGILEHYNCGGSPYWAVKAFNIFLVPEDDPFWNTPEKPLPIHRGNFSEPLRTAGLLLIGNNRTGHVQLINHKSYHDKDEYNAKYTNFAYSSVFSFDSRPVYGSCNCDSSLQWSEDGIHFFQRWEMENLYCEKDFAASRYPLHNVDSQGKGTTWTIVKDDLIVNVHRVTTKKAGILLREGSFPLGFDEGKPKTDSSAHAEFAWKEGKLIMLANLYGYDRLIQAAPFHDQIQGVNTRYWKSIVARLEKDVSVPSTHILISASLGRLGSETKSQLLAIIPKAEVEDDSVVVRFYDGEEVWLNTGKPQEIKRNIGGVTISGQPVFVRVKNGKEFFKIPSRTD